MALMVLTAGLRIRIRSDRIRCFCMDPDPDPLFKFLWIRIRIRFSNFLDPDQDPVSAKILENCRKVTKSDLSEENLKFMTKDRQKMKKATISY